MSGPQVPSTVLLAKEAVASLGMTLCWLGGLRNENAKGRRGFPSGMTNKKANAGVLRFAQNDGNNNSSGNDKNNGKKSSNDNSNDNSKNNSRSSRCAEG